METVKEKLMVAKEVISDPAKWCRGVYARGADGWSREVSSEEACQFCTLGALMRVNAYGVGVSVLKTCLPDDYANVAAFNDSATHEQVMQLFDCAIAKASEQGE